MNLTNKHEAVATVTDRYCFACISKSKDGFEPAFQAWKKNGSKLTDANKATVLATLQRDSIRPIVAFEMTVSDYNENPFDD